MEENKFSTFGNRIKALRERRGIKQGQFADDIGITRQSMSNYESGKHSPDIDVIIKIADYFECSTDYLLGLNEHPNFKEQEAYDEDLLRLSKSLCALPLVLKDAWLDTFTAMAECIQTGLSKDIQVNFEMVSLYTTIIQLMNLCFDTVDKQKDGNYTEQDIITANNKLRSYLRILIGEINDLDDMCYEHINPSKNCNKNDVNEEVMILQKKFEQLMKGENE